MCMETDVKSERSGGPTVVTRSGSLGKSAAEEREDRGEPLLYVQLGLHAACFDLAVTVSSNAGILIRPSGTATRWHDGRDFKSPVVLAT